MGLRLTRNLKDSFYRMAYLETHGPAIERLGRLVSDQPQ